MRDSATQDNATVDIPADQIAYSVPHAAIVMDLSARKVWQLVNDGDIEVIRIGRSVRIPRVALLTYIESRRDKTAGAA
jgi:excisionase family DNA binding protein